MRAMLGYYRAVEQDMKDHATLAGRPTPVPVLAVVGDGGSAPDLLARLTPLVPDLRGEVIAAAGHYVPEEQPSAPAERLAAFIRDLR